MRHAYILVLIALIAPAYAVFQANTVGDYRIALTTHPEQPVLNTPTHLELHVQNATTGGAVGELEVRELIVHLQEHEAIEPHVTGQNITEIHRDIPHRELLDMKPNPDEPPGHYHINYTFLETGAYEVVVQFKGDGNDIASVFSLNVGPEEGVREPVKPRYSLYGILAASIAVLAALAIAFRKIVESFDMK